MPPCVKLNSTSHIVETVHRWEDVVLRRVLDVPMHRAHNGTCTAHLLSIHRKHASSTQHLKVEPVVASGSNGQIAAPTSAGVRRKRRMVALRKIQRRIDHRS